MEKEKNALRKEVLRGSFLTFISTWLSKIGGLIFTVILARFLMPEGFGLYSLVFSVAILFVTFADLGINQALLKYVSSSIDKNKEKASAYFKYLLGLKFKFAFCAAVLLLILAYPLSTYFFGKKEVFLLLVILSFYIFITAMQGLFESLFYTNNKTSRILTKEIIFQITRIFIVFFIFILVKESNRVIGAISGIALSSLVAFFVTYYFYKKDFNFRIYKKVKLNDEEIKKIRTFIFYLTIVSMAGVIFSYIDAIILGAYLSLKFIGYYRAAITLIIAIAGILSFPGVFISALSKIKKQNLQDSFDKILKALMILAVPATIGLISLSKYFLVFVYGYEYLEANTLLILLSPFIFLFSATSLFLSLISAREKAREFSLITFFCALLNIFLDYIAIKIFLPFSEMHAAGGVAIATLLSWTIYFVFGVLILKNKLEIKFKFSYMIRPLIASLIMAAFLYFFNIYFTDLNVIIGVIEIIVGVIIYFATLLILGEIKKEDIEFVRKTLNPFCQELSD